MSRREEHEARFPFLPYHSWGQLLKRDGQLLLFWDQDGTIEPASSGAATHEAVLELTQHVQALIRAGVRHPARIVDALVESGYEWIGSRRYDFRSGMHYNRAQRLAELARRAADERTGIMARHGGGHPPLDHPDWNRWEEIGWTVGATAAGARVLALASVEALINEILALRFPADYQKMTKGRSKKPFEGKLKGLCSLLNIDRTSEWIGALAKEQDSRTGIVHHKPVYVDDMRPASSVELSGSDRPEAAEQLLRYVDGCFAAIFQAFGAPVPPTHQPFAFARVGDGHKLRLT